MQTQRTSLVAILCALGVFAFAGSLQSEWQSNVDSYCKMVKAKDAKGISKMINTHFASDFHYVPLKGPKMDRKAWTENEIMQLKMCKSITRMEIKLSKMKVTGDKATGMSEIHFAAIVPPMSEGEKEGKLTFDGTASMTLVKRNGKWLNYEIKETKSDLRINGKPLDPAEMGGPQSKT